MCALKLWKKNYPVIYLSFAICQAKEESFDEGHRSYKEVKSVLPEQKISLKRVAQV